MRSNVHVAVPCHLFLPLFSASVLFSVPRLLSLRPSTIVCIASSLQIQRIPHNKKTRKNNKESTHRPTTPAFAFLFFFSPPSMKRTYSSLALVTRCASTPDPRIDADAEEDAAQTPWRSSPNAHVLGQDKACCSDVLLGSSGQCDTRGFPPTHASMPYSSIFPLRIQPD